MVVAVVVVVSEIAGAVGEEGSGWGATEVGGIVGAITASVVVVAAVVVVVDSPKLIVTVATEQPPAELQIEYWKVSVPDHPPPVEYLILGDPWAIASAVP
jgi:hypothetical protein